MIEELGRTSKTLTDEDIDDLYAEADPRADPRTEEDDL